VSVVLAVQQHALQLADNRKMQSCLLAAGFAQLLWGVPSSTTLKGGLTYTGMQPQSCRTTDACFHYLRSFCTWERIQGVTLVATCKMAAIHSRAGCQYKGCFF
jgi:hypothetical protein